MLGERELVLTLGVKLGNTKIVSVSQFDSLVVRPLS
jgi:hypothetical protein